MYAKDKARGQTGKALQRELLLTGQTAEATLSSRQLQNRLKEVDTGSIPLGEYSINAPLQQVRSSFPDDTRFLARFQHFLQKSAFQPTLEFVLLCKLYAGDLEFVGNQEIIQIQSTFAAL